MFDPKGKVRVSDREIDTILAGLRAWQAFLLGTLNDAAPGILEIANNDHDNPLTVEEIDKLCEEINCGDRRG